MPRVVICWRQADSVDRSERSLSLDSQESAPLERAMRGGWIIDGVDSVERNPKHIVIEGRPEYARRIQG